MAMASSRARKPAKAKPSDKTEAKAPAKGKGKSAKPKGKKPIPKAFAKANARREGRLLTRSASWRVKQGVRKETGEVVAPEVLLGYIHNLQGLVTELAQGMIDANWSGSQLEALLGSKASFAYRALERAQGKLAVPAGLHVDSRAVWVVEEVAGRTLRSQGYQRDIITSWLETGEPGEDADRVSARNARRAINKVIQARKNAGVKGDATIPT